MILVSGDTDGDVILSVAGEETDRIKLEGPVRGLSFSATGSSLAITYGEMHEIRSISAEYKFQQ